MSKEQKVIEEAGPTQKQLCYNAGRQSAQRFNDIDWLRKHTALHHIADGFSISQAWIVEEDVNRRLKHISSILFPDTKTLDFYMSWARKQSG